MHASSAVKWTSLLTLATLTFSVTTGGKVFPAPPSAGTPPADVFNLCWKFEKGKTFFQKVVINFHQHDRLFGTTCEIQQKQICYLSYTPQRHHPDGSWTIQQRIEAMKGDRRVEDAARLKFRSESDLNFRLLPLHYPTEDTDRDEVFANFCRSMTGTKLSILLGPDMRIANAEGSRKLLQTLDHSPTSHELVEFVDNTIREAAEILFSTLPSRPVHPGDSWKQRSTIDFAIHGKAKVTSRYTAVGRDQTTPHLLRIEEVTTFRPNLLDAPLTKQQNNWAYLNTRCDGHGIILFDPAKGRIVRSTNTLNVEQIMRAWANSADKGDRRKLTQTTTVTTSDTNPLKYWY